jgi:hypothetical protein
MTSMTLNIDGTTLTLDEAITELRNLAGEIKYRTYNFQNGQGHREYVALQFALRVLAEKAEVSPARNTDPATSHRAAPEEIKAGSAREKILLAAEKALPLTARELSVDAGLGHQRSPWKRVSELVKAGFLKPVGIGTDTESGAQATTYLITTKGYAACAGLRARSGAS